MRAVSRRAMLRVMNIPPLVSAVTTTPAAIASAVTNSLAAPAPEQASFLASSGGLAPDAQTPPGITLPDLPLPQPGDRGSFRLGPPPAHGSAIETSELATLHGLQDHRTPEGDAWAQHMASAGATKVWSQELALFKQTHSLAEAITGQLRLSAAMAGAAAFSQVDKLRYRRDRPFQTDPTLVPVVAKPHDKSYPSGHATVAYAAATVLASLIPAKAQDYYDLARQVALSRVYGGVHFPSDVIAGANLGVAVGRHFADRDTVVTGAALLTPAAAG